MIRKIISRLTNFYYFLGNNSLVSFKNLNNVHFNKKIYFYSLVWGGHFDTYFSYTLPSLLHKSNYSELVNENFDLFFLIYTVDSEDLIRKKYKDFFSKYKHISFEIIELNVKNNEKPRKIASKAIINALGRCIKEKSILFVAPPDMIFGNGSVYNCVIDSFDKKLPFAAAHPRVSYEILDSIDKSNSSGIPNSELVSLAMKHPHHNFKYAISSLDSNTTYAGVSHFKVSDSLYTVKHVMPSIYLAFPLKEDYDYFIKVDDFNMWDRGWLQMLVKENRLNFGGSSDMFFCTELTPDSDKKKLISESHIFSNHTVIHNRICGMFTSVWRSS